MQEPIRPTNTCFDDALDFLELQATLFTGSRAGREKKLDAYTVVHAICQSQAPSGEYYAHAWVEEDLDLVWQGGIVAGQRIFFSVAKDEFYASRRVQQPTYYSWRAAIQENHAANHYGPWKPEYVALCKPRDKARELCITADVPLAVMPAFSVRQTR